MGLGLLALGLSAPDAAGQLPWDAGKWRIRAEESRVETYLGRECLYLRNGVAWLDQARLEDGVIEFDLSAPSAFGFHGVMFRAVDDRNYEHFYVRPFLAGNPDATQYTPVINGVSGWQIYSDERYARAVPWAPERWVHVRVIIRRREAEVTLDGGSPIRFPNLIREPVAGSVGLNSSFAGARFANVTVRPDTSVELVGEPPKAPAPPGPGVVQTWLVSSPFPEARVKGVRALPQEGWEQLTWSPLAAGTRGIANLATLGGLEGDRNTVFAALRLRAKRADTISVRFGFSDRVRVFLNRRQLYAGADNYTSRDYRFLGTIGLFDEVFLPLQAGDNDLWLAVSEDFGGWGVTLQLPAAENVEPLPPRR